MGKHKSPPRKYNGFNRFTFTRLFIILSIASSVLYGLFSWGRKENLFPPEHSGIFGMSIIPELGIYPVELVLFVFTIINLLAMFCLYFSLSKEKDYISHLFWSAGAIFLAICLTSFNFPNDLTLGQMEAMAVEEIKKENIREANFAATDLAELGFIPDENISERFTSSNPLVELSTTVVDKPKILIGESRYLKVSRLWEGWHRYKYDAGFDKETNIKEADGDTEIILNSEILNKSYRKDFLSDDEEMVAFIKRDDLKAYPTTEINFTIMNLPPNKESCFSVYLQLAKKNNLLKETEETICGKYGDIRIKKFLTRYIGNSGQSGAESDEHSFTMFITKKKEEPWNFSFDGSIIESPIKSLPALCLESKHKGKPGKTYKSIIGVKHRYYKDNPTGIGFTQPEVVIPFESGTCNDVDINYLLQNKLMTIYPYEEE